MTVSFLQLVTGAYTPGMLATASLPQITPGANQVPVWLRAYSPYTGGRDGARPARPGQASADIAALNTGLSPTSASSLSSVPAPPSLPGSGGAVVDPYGLDSVEDGVPPTRFESRVMQMDEEERARWEDLARLNGVAQSDMFVPVVWDYAPKGAVSFGGPDAHIRDPLDPKTGKAIPEGTEYTFLEAVNEYRRVNMEERARYQALLYGAGYMDDAPTVAGGLSDERYQAAWQDAVRDSAASGLPVMQYLQERAHSTGRITADGQLLDEDGNLLGEESEEERPPVQLLNPQDARRLVEETVRGLLGRDLRDDEDAIVGNLVSQIHGEQTAYQDTLYEAGLAGDARTVEQAPSPTTIVEEGVEEEFADEIEGYRIAEAFVQIMGMMGEGGS